MKTSTLLLFLAMGLHSWAASVAAASCSLKDVQAAITRAGRNGAVTVPACPDGVNWGASTLTLTYGITLRGAGADATVIATSLAAGGHAPVAIEPDAKAIADEEVVQIAGFTFDGRGEAYNLITGLGAGVRSSKPFRNLIISNNKFQNMASTEAENGVIYLTGQFRGVIYGNTFDRCAVILKIMGSDLTAEWTSPAYVPFSFGSADNLYFEDNKILYSSAYSADDPGWTEVGQGGRLVMRFNRWDLARITSRYDAPELWDVHGFQNYMPGVAESGQTGTMLVEDYDNVISTPKNGIRWIIFRGGWGMFFDNSATTAGAVRDTRIEIDQYPTGCASEVTPPPTGLYIPEVNNTYLFHNVVNGSIIDMKPGATGNHCGTSENGAAAYPLGYWNYTAGFNGAAGVGRGPKAAIPATCTRGVGYWVTDEGSWNRKLPANTSGRFYKCTATDTWTLYYTPYTYPHPLRSRSARPAARRPSRRR